MKARATTLVLILLDIAAVVTVFNLITYARGIGPGRELVTTPLVGPTALLLSAVYLVQGYRARTDMLSVDYASQHAIATIGAMVATLLVTFVFLPVGYELQSSRFVIAVSFLALIPMTLGYRRLFYLRAAAAADARTIVFVGDLTSSEAFRDECAKMGISQAVIYAAPDQAEPHEPLESASTAYFSDVLDDVQQGRIKVEAVVLRETSRELEPDISQRLIELYFRGVPTFTLELFHEVYWQKIPLYRLNQTWLFQEGFQIAREPVFERAKRAADIFLACAGLVIFAPFVVPAAVAIFIEDRGGVLFRQTRIGKNHVPFTAYKLRTMRTMPGNTSRYTQPGDVRITQVGRLLRGTRLDEVPQLWNVLRGDMSMIGPRAEWDQLVREYEPLIPCYHFRHLVRPGITGWAQVNYPYGASVADTLRKLEFDLYYIRHFSFRLDATIVFKTIHIMLFGKGR